MKKNNINNKQNNINIKAWWDVNNWVINNQVDNSWYNISKENTTFLDIIWKEIISKLWDKWWLISWIILIILWWITVIKNTIDYLNNGIKFDFTKNWEWISLSNILSNINIDWLLWFLWIMIFWLWVLIIRSIENKSNRQCPMCEKQYSLIEIWTPKEKEVKTSKGYRVTQIRNYKCESCNFKKTEEDNFIRPSM